MTDKVLKGGFMFRIIFMALIVALAVSGAYANEVFINWSAGYYISMPEDWHHVSYSTVNIFLESQNVNLTDFVYDAVIAKKSDRPFFEEPYVFMIHHPVGELNDSQIDSVLQEVSRDYKNEIRKAVLDSGDRTFSLDRPVYDESRKMVAVKSRISTEFIDKYMLEIRRFYDKGVAIFLCYATKEAFNDAQRTFVDIANSLSTKDLADMAPKDSAQFVDVTKKERAKYDEDDFSGPGKGGLSAGTGRILMIFFGIIIVGIIVGFIIKSKKK